MKNLILSLLSLMVSGGTYAQIPISPPLYHAIQEAVKNDAGVRNDHLEIEKMEIEQRQVRHKFLPRLEADATYAYLNNDLIVDVPTQTLPFSGIQLFDGKTVFDNSGQALIGGLELSQVVFSGGQITNGAKALKYKNEGTAHLMEISKDEIIKGVITDFDQLALLYEAEKLLDNSEKRLNKETERVEKAIAAGLAIPYDRDKIKLAILELTSKRRDVENKKELLVAKLIQSTKLDRNTILNTIYQLEPIIIESGLSMDNKNEIKALEAFKTAGEFAVKKEKGSLLPSVGAFASYKYISVFDLHSEVNLNRISHKPDLRFNQLTLNPTFIVGIGMRWNIFEGFERKEKIEQAQLSLQQITLKLNDAKEKMDLLLSKNLSEYENATEQISIHEQRKQIAENNNILAQKQYANGLMSINNRLEAENDTFKASLDWYEAIARQRQKAIETYQSTGILTRYLTVK